MATHAHSIAEALESRQLRDAVEQVLKSRILVREVTEPVPPAQSAPAPAESPVSTKRTQFLSPTPSTLVPAPSSTERSQSPSPTPSTLIPAPSSTERTQFPTPGP